MMFPPFGFTGRPEVTESQVTMSGEFAGVASNLCRDKKSAASPEMVSKVTSAAKDLRGLTDESSGAVAVANSNLTTTEELLVRWESGADLTTGTAADRRVWIGWFREDVDDPPNEDVVGFVVNDRGWAIFDASVEWAASNDITTDRQLGLPVADLVTTSWLKDDATNYFADVDDGKVPDSATTGVTSPNNPINSPISFDLTSLTDPTNTVFHTLAVGWRRAGGGRTLTLTIELRQGYANESTLGTLIATKTDTAAAGGMGDETYLQVGVVGDVVGFGGSELQSVAAP